jgi:putative Holliday junction resolvase
LTDLPHAEHGGERILALDVGEARIGLAVSDETGVLATPTKAIKRTDPNSDARAVIAAAERVGASRIVVGMPVSLNGTHGSQARKVQGFRRVLIEATDLPVKSWDERFSTVEAERRLRESGIEPSRDRARLDSAAAAIILQSFLDQMSLD